MCKPALTIRHINTTQISLTNHLHRLDDLADHFNATKLNFFRYFAIDMKKECFGLQKNRNAKLSLGGLDLS